MRMDERNTMHIKSELYDTTILSYARHQLQPVRGEHISLGKHVIGVHIHSKDAHGREEHDAHKIRAL